MEPLFDVSHIVHLVNHSVERWHSGPVVHDQRESLMLLVSQLHGFNFQLWHEEDLARDPSSGAKAIARVKRNIDGFNQKRNNTMEKVDEFVLEGLAGRGVQAIADAPLHSETVGSIVDRLSIIALKVYHMREETLRQDAEEAHRATCGEKLAILEEQQRDLAGCLESLQDDLLAGRRRFKVYRQMKMYNDPSLNPVLYGKAVNPDAP